MEDPLGHQETSTTVCSHSPEMKTSQAPRLARVTLASHIGPLCYKPAAFGHVGQAGQAEGLTPVGRAFKAEAVTEEQGNHQLEEKVDQDVLLVGEALEQQAASNCNGFFSMGTRDVVTDGP